MTPPMLYETHMHTPLCRHATGEPQAYAEAALERGLKGIIVTCHAPLPDGYSPAVRMRREEWSDYVNLVAACREEFEGRLDVRLGLESDYVPGLEAWLRDLHAREPLNYVLGSVHPQTPEYRERYLDETDWPGFHRGYFSHLALAAETGLFDCLSHPDLVKNYGSEFYDADTLLPHILKCLDRIAETGVAMELNTSGVNKTIPEMNPAPEILRAMRERDIPVVVGADAHEPDRVADGFPEALRLLRDCGFERVRVYLERAPVDMDLGEALDSLRVPCTAP